MLPSMYLFARLLFFIAISLFATGRGLAVGVPHNIAFPPAGADLTLTFSVSDETPCLSSEPLTYTLSIANNGPDGATNVAVTSLIPSGLTFQSAASTQGSFNPGTGIWSVGTLTNGTTASINLVATVNVDQGGATITSHAEITAADQLDYDLSTNSSSLSVVVRNNHAPEVSAISDQTTHYNNATDLIEFTISDQETTASLLNVTGFASNVVYVPHENIAVGGEGSERTLQIIPGLNQHGATAITIEVSDGVCAVRTSFDLTINKQTYSTWQSANVVVGQANFTHVNAATVSRAIAHGSNNTAVSAKGVLAVGSQTARRVLLWNSVPSENGVEADLVVGKNDFTSSGQNCSQSLVSNVDGVAFSPDGNKLLVSDAGNNRVLIWNTLPTTNGQPADVVIGQSNFTNNSSGTGANKFDRPTELLVTPDGKLLVTDRNNHRVLIFNQIPIANNASADVVIGQTNMTNNGAATTQSRFRSPWNCSLAPDGKLLVADDGNHRVLVFNRIPTSNGASADLVIGQSNFTTGTSGSSDSKFNSPGVTVSPTGMVAIADFGNNRVLIFNQTPTENGAPADAVLGQPDLGSRVSFNDGAGVAGGPSDKNMSQPYGINFDLNERLYVNGRQMHRVMIFGETPTDVSDLSISFDSDVSSPCMGNPVSYTIHVQNAGPASATNVVVTSALPHGFTPQSVSATGGVYNSQSGYWTIPYIPNGGEVSLTLTGTVNAGMGGATIRAYASVRSYNQADNNFANNSGYVDVAVISNHAPEISDIANTTTDYNMATDAIHFTISDVESSAASLSLEAFSSNTNLVPHANIVLGGSGVNRTISILPAANQTGEAEITISVSDGVCTSYETFTLSVGNVWLGQTSDWNTLANWSLAVPDDNTGAFIPTAPTGGNFPVISHNVTSKGLTISSGASLIINSGRTLTLLGDYANEGISGTGSGTLLMAGSALQLAEGPVTHFSVSNSAGILMSDNLEISGVLILAAGILDINGHELTIKGIVNPVGGHLGGNSSSTLVIEGSGDAGVISFGEGAATLRRFRINRTSQGSVMLGSDLTITDRLMLNNGVITTGENILTVTNTSPTNAIIGYANNSYVNGHLRRYVNTTGSYNFPVGSDEEHQLIRIDLNYSSGITYLDASFTKAITGTLPNFTMGTERVTEILNNGIWTVSPDAVNSVNYDVSIVARGHGNGRASHLEHTLIKRDNSASPWGSYGVHNSEWVTGNNNGPITAKRAGLTGFSDFGVGLMSSTLPVTLVSFTAEQHELGVVLHWATASEVNNDFFEIDRSADGEVFDLIGRVYGRGTSNERQDYTYLDEHRLSGSYYYRLSQTDFDGTREVFRPVYVTIPDHEEVSELLIYPNPVSKSNGVVYLELSNLNLTATGSHKVFITNCLGQKALLHTFLPSETIGTISLPLGTGIEKGIYFITLQGKNEAYIKKLMVE